MAETVSSDQTANSWLRGCWQYIGTKTASPRPLACFRIGLAAVLLVQALSLIGHLEELHGRHGIVEWSVMSDGGLPLIPNLEWLDKPLSLLGISESFLVPLSFALYVGSLFALLIGYRTRLAACVALLTHAALLTGSELSVYGVDRFAQIGLFYCLWFPAGHALSLDASASRVNPRPSFEAWLGLRVLQLHVCIAYVASGVEKAMGEQWWNGEAIWRAVMSPHDGQALIDCSFLAGVPWLAAALGWMTLLLEAGAFAFVWHSRTRLFWLVGVVGMHVGIALTLNLWIFAATMIVFDVAAFGVSPRPCNVSSEVTPADTRVTLDSVLAPSSSRGKELIHT